ncbi:MAG: prenyltransferase/squalene oxidase repeat-containing protein [Thermoguttaceae bacterium]
MYTPHLSLITFSILVSFTVCLRAETLRDADVDRVVERGLDWLAARQSSRGGWDTQQEMYPTAMTGLAGVALLMEGSTPVHGKYAPQIRAAVDFLLDRSRSSGLVGDDRDDRYTYGHGFALLFLSQVLGEEDDTQRRDEIVDVITRGVDFCGKAQTRAGGWGYVSAKDGRDFDEGSTTITQVQALRGARNAGIAVPKEIIDSAVGYIHRCAINGGSGGIAYNIHGGGGRPPISAAAIACLFNAGEYDDAFVPALLKYCDEHLFSTQDNGHWHYAQYYFSQVKYREGGEAWENYKAKIFPVLISQAQSDGAWNQSSFGSVYTTSIALTILQLDRATLPIYQR